MDPEQKQHPQENKHLPAVDASLIASAKQWVEGYLANQPGITIEWLDSLPENLRLAVNGRQAMLGPREIAGIGAIDDSVRKDVAAMLDALVRR